MSRWYFWVLAPVMLVSAWIIGALTEPPTLFGRVVAYTISASLVAATFGLANPNKFSWAIRFVAAAIFLMYLAYTSTQLLGWMRGEPFGGDDPGNANLRNAILGLLIVGVPAARIAFSRSVGNAPSGGEQE